MEMGVALKSNSDEQEIIQYEKKLVQVITVLFYNLSVIVIYAKVKNKVLLNGIYGISSPFYVIFSV